MNFSGSLAYAITHDFFAEDIRKFGTPDNICFIVEYKIHPSVQ